MQNSSHFTPFRFLLSFLFASVLGFALGSAIDIREHSFPLFSLAFVAVVTYFFIRHRWPKQNFPCAPAPVEWPSAPPAPRPEPSAPAPPRHAFRSFGIMQACALLLLASASAFANDLPLPPAGAKRFGCSIEAEKYSVVPCLRWVTSAKPGGGTTTICAETKTSIGEEWKLHIFAVGSDGNRTLSLLAGVFDSEKAALRACSDWKRRVRNNK